MSVRPGHEWACGPPGSWSMEDLKKLAGRWVACPDCKLNESCHIGPIISKFKTEFPNLEPPVFVSMCTKVIDGNGGLRDILVSKDAVFAGCKPPHGAPTVRDLGVSLPASIFGNPEVQKRLDDKKQKAQQTKLLKKQAILSASSSSSVTKHDLPKRTIAEANAEWSNLFEQAWAQKRERDAVEAKGQVFVPEWQRAASKLQPSEKRTTNTAHARNRWQDSDSDSD